jgi:hypothetical protein
MVLYWPRLLQCEEWALRNPNINRTSLGLQTLHFIRQVTLLSWDVLDFKLKPNLYFWDRYESCYITRLPSLLPSLYSLSIANSSRLGLYASKHIIINFIGNIWLQHLVLRVRLAIVPSSHGDFLWEIQQKTAYVTWSSSWHFAVIIVTSGAGSCRW